MRLSYLCICANVFYSFLIVEFLGMLYPPTITDETHIDDELSSGDEVDEVKLSIFFSFSFFSV